jgi:hypothetical protein
MSARIFSSRDFTRDVAAAKAAALTGPVLITDCGHPAFVMINIGEYHRLVTVQSEALFVTAFGIGAMGACRLTRLSFSLLFVTFCRGDSPSDPLNRGCCVNCAPESSVYLIPCHFSIAYNRGNKGVVHE